MIKNMTTNLGMLLMSLRLTFDMITMSMIGDRTVCRIERANKNFESSSVLGSRMLLTRPSTENIMRLVPKSARLIIFSLFIEIDLKNTSLVLKP